MEMFTAGNEINFKVIEGIPKGAELEGYGYDPNQAVLVLTVKHPSFKPIKELGIIPSEQIIAEKTY
jgi:hypothetical protein